MLNKKEMEISNNYTSMLSCLSDKEITSEIIYLIEEFQNYYNIEKLYKTIKKLYNNYIKYNKK